MNRYHALGVMVLAVTADQFTKELARLLLFEPVQVWPGFFLRLAHNTGIAFSWPVPLWLVVILGVSVVGYLGYELWTKSLNIRALLAYTLILAGAIGNLIDLPKVF